MNYRKWIAHFERNKLNRSEPDWAAPITIPRRKLKALLKTLAEFQLGDGGGPCCLIARNAERFTGVDPELERVVDLWFEEEAGHARLLGCAVDRFGGRRIQSHWSFTAFCAVRRWLGVRFELQVLLLTELVSTAYYRVLQRRVGDVAVRAMCGLILRDEAGHVAFHRDRLAHANPTPASLPGAVWQLQFWLCGLAAASVLWLSHGPCLQPFGATTREYFSEVRREIGGFIARLVARCRAMATSRESTVFSSPAVGPSGATVWHPPLSNTPTR